MTESKNTQDEASQPAETSNGHITSNKVVAFHFRLCEVNEQGEHSEWLEQSNNREPLYYLHGFHNVIVGVENSVSVRFARLSRRRFKVWRNSLTKLAVSIFSAAAK